MISLHDEYPAPVGQDLHAALHRGAGRDLVEPALQVRVVVPVDALVLMVKEPININGIRYIGSNP